MANKKQFFFAVLFTYPAHYFMNSYFPHSYLHNAHKEMAAQAKPAYKQESKIDQAVSRMNRWIEHQEELLDANPTAQTFEHILRELDIYEDAARKDSTLYALIDMKRINAIRSRIKEYKHALRK